MPLADYSYIATLGQNCGPCFQLQRAAGSLQLHPERVSGPFDWFLVDVPQATQVLRREFLGYFTPAESTVLLQDGRWRLTDKSGITAWHQLKADTAELGPSATTWWSFGMWLGARIQSWQTHARDPRGKLLLIRHEGSFEPDAPEDLRRLLDLLREQIAGQFLLLWLRYDRSNGDFEDPNLRTFSVQRSWPAHLKDGEIDCDRDYGFGTAWRGRDEDWERIWSSI